MSRFTPPDIYQNPHPSFLSIVRQGHILKPIRQHVKISDVRNLHICVSQESGNTMDVDALIQKKTCDCASQIIAAVGLAYSKKRSA